MVLIHYKSKKYNCFKTVHVILKYKYKTSACTFVYFLTSTVLVLEVYFFKNQLQTHVRAKKYKYNDIDFDVITCIFFLPEARFISNIN